MSLVEFDLLYDERWRETKNTCFRNFESFCVYVTMFLVNKFSFSLWVILLEYLIYLSSFLSWGCVCNMYITFSLPQINIGSK